MTPDSASSTPRRTSFGQRRLWFADEIGQQGLEFVYPYALRLQGGLDKSALARALGGVVSRQASLRTTYGLVDDEPHQWIHSSAKVTIEEHQLAGLGADGVLPSSVRADIERPFDLVNGPLLRMSLYEISAADHLLLVVVHHIATDGWSMDVFFQDLAALYNAELTGHRADLADLTMQYADFADWQRGLAESGAVDAELAYWRGQLQDAPLVVDLPTDRPRPASQSYRGECVTFTIPAPDVQRLTGTARDCSASPFMAILAALHVTLARWSGQDDFIIGTPLAHRPLPETERLIGFFVNLLPFRLRTDERASFREMLARTRDVAFDAYDHQAVTFDRVVEELAPARTLAYNPVIQVTLTDETALPARFEGLIAEVLDARLDITRYDLAFDYRPAVGGGLRFDLYFASDLFDRATIELLADQFAHTIASSLAEPERPLRELPLIDPPPRPGAGPAAAALQLTEVLADIAKADPDRVAVISGERSLTFAQLDDAASRLAQALRGAGADRGGLVGVCLPRSTELLIALVGVWRSGAAFVPLDPAYPPARLAMMIADSGAEIVVCAPDATMAWDDSVRLVRIDAAHADADAATIRPAEPGDPSDRAYVIFTSGSTGRPKGVEVSHQAVAALLHGLAESGCYREGPARVGWNASVSFDASVQQWARVYRGDTIIVLDEQQRTDTELFAEAVRQFGVTDLDITPSHLHALRDVLPSALGERAGGQRPRLFVGGEPIPAALWAILQDWSARGIADAVNVYGPTECTVDATACLIEGDRPHIGTPLPGVRAYLLDPWWREVPDGMDGELYLAGAQVADGYLGRPGLTAARFVPDIFAADGSWMYRTGDLMRRIDERLEFRGRRDDQVKIRGYRVELGEIGAVLAEASGVDAVAACVTGDGQTLAAGYVSAAGISPDQVRGHAAAHLPAHMVPSILVRVDMLPRTPSGKTDRAALARQLAHGGIPALPDEGAGSTFSGPIEQLIGAVWTEVLGAGSVSPHDNFFSLGGHSLLAIRLVARIKQSLALRVPIAAVFEHATLRDLASHVEQLIRDELCKAEHAPRT